MLAKKAVEFPTNDRAPPAFSAIHAKLYQLTFRAHHHRSHPDLPGQSHTMPQDLPPTGGYGAVQYKVWATFFRPPSISNSRLTDPPLQRNIPTRGLKPAYYLLGVGLVMAYGWRKVFIGAREKKYALLECPQPCTCPHSTSPPAPQLIIITRALITHFPNTASSPARKCGHAST